MAVNLSAPKAESLHPVAGIELGVAMAGVRNVPHRSPISNGPYWTKPNDAEISSTPTKARAMMECQRGPATAYRMCPPSSCPMGRRLRAVKNSAR